VSVGQSLLPLPLSHLPLSSSFFLASALSCVRLRCLAKMKLFILVILFLSLAGAESSPTKPSQAESSQTETLQTESSQTETPRTESSQTESFNESLWYQNRMDVEEDRLLFNLLSFEKNKISPGGPNDFVLILRYKRPDTQLYSEVSGTTSCVPSPVVEASA
jgi:hypothetical protein